MSIEDEFRMFKSFEKMAEITGANEDDIIKQKHDLILTKLKKSLGYYKNADIVEFEQTTIPSEKIQVMWENLHVYSYDIDNFFINECVMHLYSNGKLGYKIYFTKGKENDISIVVTLKDTDEVVAGGAIFITEGKFVPYSAMNNRYYNIFKNEHIKEGLPVDRQFIANRMLLNAFSNFIIVNQFVNNQKDVVIETSKRVEIKSNNKKKQKHKSKKTKLIRCIKIDVNKAKKVYQSNSEDNEFKREYERHAQQWTRRGHYRKLKNGNVKWIEPQVIVAKNKPKDEYISKKVYKIQ